MCNLQYQIGSLEISIFSGGRLEYLGLRTVKELYGARQHRKVGGLVK